MPVGPFGPSPQPSAEMPNHSAVIVTCLGTVTVTRITRCSPGRTRMRGTWPSLRGGKDTPLMVGVNTTRNGIGGQEAPGGQDRGEEQPPIAQTPIASAATSPARRTVTLLGRTAARTGCSQQSAGVPFLDSTVPACPLRARLGGESGRTAVTPDKLIRPPTWEQTGGEGGRD